MRRTKLGDVGNDYISVHVQPAGPALRVADIVRSLERILDHPLFRSSPQLSAFLDYVVKEEIAGRGSLIKAYSVAVDALGRPESFDAARDPSIRVMANRLRKALETYYQRDAAAGPVRIVVVKGSYRPTLVPMRPAEAAPRLARPQPSARRDRRRERLYFRTVVALSIMVVLMAVYIAFDLFDHPVTAAVTSLVR